MRPSAVFLIAAVLGTAGASAQTPPVCTGLCLQQVPGAGGTCPAGQTTSISGVIYAPNGTDPLPNVQVYIPNDVVAAFTPGVQCPIVGTPPSGSPLVGAISATDGTFTITDVPVGTNIPLVFVSGRWRRQIFIPTTTACSNTALIADQTRFPRNHSEGDIPLFAVATGSVDSVECVLRKVGIDDSEFTLPTDSGGTGRVQLFSGSGSPGARTSSSTPSQSQLMANLNQLQEYDVLMLPCQGGQYSQTAAAESNFDTFVNNGGRVYSSHYSYVWMYYPAYTTGPFAGVANWQLPSLTTIAPDPGLATINQNFAGGLTLAKWLQQLGATTTQGQISLGTLKRDTSGVVSPTQSWMTLNNTTYGNPVMQFVFDTPLPIPAAPAPNQCGRVLFNEYHVENTTANISQNVNFPAECSATPMTPQEKLLEFMLFELTDEGGAATLTPPSQDFGSVPLGFPSTSIPFTLTNNSTFAANGPSIATTGDFSQTNNCSSIPAGASCTINVVYTPTIVGPGTGTLSASVGATSLLSTLTGTGIPDLAFSIPNLSYGSLDVGASASQTFTVTNTATGPVGVSGIVIASTPGGNFSYTTDCPIIPNKLAAGASCHDTIVFKPTTTGPITGSVAVTGSGTTPTTLNGNGIDFTIAPTPASSTTIAGNSVTFTTLTTPLAGFANNVNLTCNTTVPGTTCTIVSPSIASFVPTSPVTTTFKITTTSQYTVIGYTGFGSRGLLWLIGLASGAFLLITRRRTGSVLRLTVVLIMLGVATIGISGCSGKLPAQNPVYTAPGTYNFTVSATDGFLNHAATYALTVTAK